MIISSILKINKIIKKYHLVIYSNYLKIHHYLNIIDHHKILNKLKVGTYSIYLENGGRARVTSFLLNYLCHIKFFDLYLYTSKKKNNNEYLINENIKRILIKSYTINNLIKEIKKKRLEVFIYQLSNYSEINIFNNLKKIKIIFIQHQSFFFWIYSNYTYFKYLYETYRKPRFIISLIHLENDYIFKKWGIKSILMNNFITYDYNHSLPSNLMSKNIIMIGRADDIFKRFELGIQAMEYISKEIPESQMSIISNLTNIFFLKNIINNLILKNYIKFYDYTSNPEIYFQNASLHISTSISESFGLVLSETKIYGIPNILLGLDYISIKKGGIIIIYDDSAESIAKEIIKILLNNQKRKNMGYEARISMKNFKNEILIKKWVKLILSIYFYDNYQRLRESDKKISEKEALGILQNQINLLNMRKTNLKNVSINDIENFIFIE